MAGEDRAPLELEIGKISRGGAGSINRPRRPILPAMIDTTERRATWEREVGEAHRRARAAALALAGMALAHVFLAAVATWQLRSPYGLSREIARLGGLAEGGLHLVTVVLFLRWLARSVNVAHLLRVSPRLPWSASQACWGFFIPILNLFRPYQVIRDLQSRLAPDGVPEPLPKPRADGVGGYRQVAMEKAPPPAKLPHASIGAWWGLYLLGRSGAQSSALLLGSFSGETVRLQIILMNGADVAAALLAMMVVRSIDGRIAERHRRLHHASDEELTEWGVLGD
jgi:hypothetical protein